MTSTLIGREHPAAVLRGEIDRAATSHGGLVLVTGEAGIGKTALVTDAVERARERGALVLGGTCWDSASAPGYWPWTQVVRALRRTPVWDAAQDVAGAELAVLLGEPGGGADGGAASGDGFRLHDAVTTALVAASQRQPIVVVLDDLHWADPASVRLLEFAARHTWFERLLLIGTYRDVEVEWGEHPLRPLLSALAAKATTVTLTGLDRAGVGGLMSRTAGREPDDALVGEVHRRTGGNPFFVEQTVRLWQGGGTVTAIAPGVRDTVQRRLSLLPPGVVETLAAAAVLGREFDRRLLAAAAGEPVPHVDRLLDQAVAARLVAALGGGRFSFAHDLVRETLYEGMDGAEARKAHAGVVRAIGASPALAERALPAELARHAHLAGDEIAPAVAVRHLKAAARHAASRMAHEEASEHLLRALDRAPDAREHVLILLLLAGSQGWLGDTEACRRTFEDAAKRARELDDPELLARVALTAYRHDAAGDRTVLLEEAHRRLVGGTDGALPLIRIAQELSSAVAGLAREDGDEESLAFGLWARHDSLLEMGQATEREALTGELTDLAKRSGDRTAAAFASSFQWVALFEQGDPRFLDPFREFVRMTDGEESLIWRLASLVDRSIIASALGRFTEADALLDEMRANQLEDAPDFSAMDSHVRWNLRLLQGRSEETGALLASMDENRHPCADLVRAFTAVWQGDAAAGRRLLATVADRDEPYPPVMDSLWLRFQALTAAESGDADLCERARADLLPFEDLWAVGLYGCDIGGPMKLWLGALDAAQGRWDAAVDRLTAAYRSADRLGARPWSVKCRVRLAGALAGRGGPGDRDAARALYAEVADEAAELDMRGVAARVREAVASLGAPPAPTTPDTAASADVFRFDGQVWTLAYAGATVHLPDTKGLRDLHLLLGRPGTEVPAVHLLDPAGGEVVVASRRMGGDPVLDEEAKAAYKRRLETLDDEIDRAAARGDEARAADHDRERAALLEELRAAAGLAGRDRRLGDEAERARKTVTARIRDTLRKLDRHHPELAEHLRATVTTGTTCAYNPDTDPTWRL